MTGTTPAEAVDVVVVGSGPVGSAFARTVADLAPTSMITMVEVGPQTTDPPGHHTRNLPDAAAEAALRRAQGPEDSEVHAGGVVFWQRLGRGEQVSEDDIIDRPGLFRVGAGARRPGEDGLIAASMSSAVGGMGVLWTGSCPRPGGFEVIPFIDPAEMAGDLDRADRLLGASTSAHERSTLGREVRSVLAEMFDGPGRRPVQPLPLAVSVREGRPQWSGTDVTLRDLPESRERFELRSATLCRRVIIEGSRVVGVELEDRTTGSRSTLGARCVFIAADGLRTPQLLHASGVRPPALGRYLNDQVNVVGLVKLHEDIVAAAGGDDADLPPISATWIPLDDVTLPFHGQALQIGTAPVQQTHEGGRRMPPGLVGLSWYAAKELQWSDRVGFRDDATDAYGMPAMEISYSFTDADRRANARLVDTVADVAARLGTLLHPAPVQMPNGSSMHYQGATRMGRRDDGTSVCDPNARVWGFANLFVGGNNVIPSSTACNPTVTSVALAVRSAREVARRISPGPT